MEALAQREMIARFYDDMWSRFDHSVFSEILDPAIRFRGSLGQEKVGYTEFGECVDFIAAFSPDFHNTILTTIAEGNQTFARLSYTGTHRGKLFGVEPAGTTFEYAGAAVFSFSADRIAEVWVLGDIHGLLQQLR
jgi:predicted ester cyclase